MYNSRDKRFSEPYRPTFFIEDILPTIKTKLIPHYEKKISSKEKPVEEKCTKGCCSKSNHTRKPGINFILNEASAAVNRTLSNSLSRKISTKIKIKNNIHRTGNHDEIVKGKKLKRHPCLYPAGEILSRNHGNIREKHLDTTVWKKYSTSGGRCHKVHASRKRLRKEATSTSNSHLVASENCSSESLVTISNRRTTLKSSKYLNSNRGELYSNMHLPQTTVTSLPRFSNNINGVKGQFGNLSSSNLLGLYGFLPVYSNTNHFDCFWSSPSGSSGQFLKSRMPVMQKADLDGFSSLLISRQQSQQSEKFFSEATRALAQTSL